VKQDRTSPAQFVREVRDELRKVVWPTRKELVTYTTVALIFILVMVGIVTSLDYGFTKLVLVLFG
jgi:preprotein translocase subunit SecE